MYHLCHTNLDVPMKKIVTDSYEYWILLTVFLGMVILNSCS